MPVTRRTLATLRNAELGFLGVTVMTRVQTPRFWGHDCNAGALFFLRTASRPLRTSWLIVGIPVLSRNVRESTNIRREMSTPPPGWMGEGCRSEERRVG